MMVTSIPYETTGRVRQKLRTKAELVASARTLLERGAVPSVEDAAEAAGISRTTAYRYFQNRSELLRAVVPEVEETSLLGPNPPVAVEERLELVIRRLGNLIIKSEALYRTMLRLSLEEPAGNRELVLRTGRAIAWIEEALSPLRASLPPEQLRRLVLAIRSAVGIEALVWLTDIAGLSRKQALETMVWSARALLRAAIEESLELPPPAG